MKFVMWSIWARVVGLAACYCLVGGGIIDCFYDSDLGIGVGVYSIVVGLSLAPFFWPVLQLGKVLLLGQKFYLMGFVCLALSALPYFEIPTFIGGVALSITGAFFMFGAWKGEKGKDLDQLAGRRR
mmetsp:Transcript_9569/g.14412  ORF Transcript_9569/g.14412 Transcript_9569/m.14412 type:complete len:126 (+) Transcript_9569:33-410(+)